MRTQNSRFVQYMMLLVVFFFMVSCEKDDGPEPVKTRTLMVYLAGDNNLASYMEDNIEGMRKAWKKDYNANIVIFFDTKEGAKLLTFDIGKKGVVTERVIKTYDKMNSASSETLGQILKEMQAAFPAESYGLIMGSHAQGWIPHLKRTSAFSMRKIADVPLTRSFGVDGSQEMDVRDMAKVIPEGIDFILFDACLMSSMEVVYELRNCAKYVVASPAELSVYGFPYEQIMPYFWGKGSELEDDLVKVCSTFIEYYNLVEYYKPFNTNFRFGTITLINMAEMNNLYTITKKILQGHKSEVANMKVDDIYTYPMVSLRSSNRDFCYYYDFGNYIKHMTVGQEGRYDEFKRQLDRVVLYKNVTKTFYNQNDEDSPLVIPAEKYSGISTYIPRSVWTSWTNAYWGFSWAGVYE